MLKSYRDCVEVVILVMVPVFFLLACEFLFVLFFGRGGGGEGYIGQEKFRRIIACLLFKNMKSARALHFTMWPRISTQWHSELRRLWTSVPRRVACVLVSL